MKLVEIVLTDPRDEEDVKVVGTMHCDGDYIVVQHRDLQVRIPIERMLMLVDDNQHG